jgi:hypothetical protein
MVCFIVHRIKFKQSALSVKVNARKGLPYTETKNGETDPCPR